MNAASSSRRRRTRPYFWIGLLALTLISAGSYTDTYARAQLPEAAHFWWSVSTGTALVACIGYQWLLLLTRLAGKKREARDQYHRHRLVGTASVCLFLLHAGAIGYALLTVLPLVYLAIAITGLLNSEVLPLRRPWMRRCWGYVHIGLSGLLMPLVAFHVWAALAFK